MFGKDRFSLTRFGLGSEDTTLPVEFTALENLGNVAGYAVPIESEAYFSALFRGDVLGTVSVPTTLNLAGALNTQVQMVAEIVTRTAAGENLSQQVEGSQQRSAGTTLSAALGGSFGAGKTFSAQSFLGDCSLSQSVTGYENLMAHVTAEETLTLETSALKNLCIHAAPAEILSQVTAGSRDEVLHLSLSETLYSVNWGSKTVPIPPFQGEDALCASAWAGKNIVIYSLLDEVLSMLTEATLQDTEQAVFTLSIPSGGELRIDSETYQVTLDGENVLYLQEGDWIWLSRSLLRLDVEAASGGSLSGSMIYTERYL